MVKNRKLNACKKLILSISTVLALIVASMHVQQMLQSNKIPEKYQEFLKDHPKYGYNGTIYKLKRDQFKYFPKNETYLDYTGAGMYQWQQVKKAVKALESEFKCNTHSTSSCSANTEKAIEDVRDRIVEHFNVPLGTYSVIFTQSTTAGLRLLGDAFPWTSKSKYLYSKVNHNSVLGIRKFAQAHNASYQTMDWDIFNKEIINNRSIDAKKFVKDNMLVDESQFTHNLVAFPAEDNFSGLKFPLELVTAFEQNDYGSQFNEGHWHVLLDAAAFLPTNPLNLSKYPASFVVMSFYKMFGWPTGIGALLIRNDLGLILQKGYFGGGSVVTAGVDNDFVQLKPKYNEKFEDGTLDFHSIDSLRFGFDAIQQLGMENIQAHVWAVTRRFYERLEQMKHTNGVKMAVVYGQHKYNDPKKQGGIVTFNLKDAEGKYIRFSIVQQKTTDAGFMIRAGCSCNPGSCNNHLELNELVVKKINEERKDCSDEKDNIDGQPIGAVRVSFGYPTTLEEVDALADFLEKTFTDFVGAPYIKKVKNTMGLFQ